MPVRVLIIVSSMLGRKIICISPATIISIPMILINPKILLFLDIKVSYQIKELIVSMVKLIPSLLRNALTKINLMLIGQD